MPEDFVIDKTKENFEQWKTHTDDHMKVSSNTEHYIDFDHTAPNKVSNIFHEDTSFDNAKNLDEFDLIFTN